MSYGVGIGSLKCTLSRKGYVCVPFGIFYIRCLHTSVILTKFDSMINKKEKITWFEDHRIPNPPPRDGDVCYATVQVQVMFEHRDDIIRDHDEESGMVEYESGLVMHILDECLVYNGEETLHIASSFKEKGKTVC